MASISDWAVTAKRLESWHKIKPAEEPMDEEALNMSIRKFLKKVGITAQREIERALHEADQAGQLDGSPVPVKMTLECDLIVGGLLIEDDIKY
jgi:hypothetical protein